MIFKSISTKSETKQGCLLSPLPFDIVPKVLVKAVKKKRERLEREKEIRDKIADSYRHYNVSIENPKESRHAIRMR